MSQLFSGFFVSLDSHAFREYLTYLSLAGFLSCFVAWSLRFVRSTPGRSGEPWEEYYGGYDADEA